MIKNYLSSVLLLQSLFFYSQVGIGTSSPNLKSSLEIFSTTKGMLVPRMTTSQRDAIAPGTTENGLLIYNTDTNCFNYWSRINVQWMALCGTNVTTPLINNQKIN
jgi:hypothetical protein